MSSLSENRSSLREFLASIATIRGDLSNITAPPFVLATKSVVEFPQYWAEHPCLFTAPSSEADPQKRALLVLKWFLGSLKSQQYAGRSPDEGVKKPLNAFLGELFIAHWKDDSGTTHLISEQVSHHPPVTATTLWNDEHGIRAEGYTCQEITFSGTVNIKQIGHAILHIDRYDEAYLIPLPSVKVRGILSGSLYPELNGNYLIPSTNGFTSEVDFSGRGFFSGTKNSFQAKLYRDGHPNEPIYTIKGQWSDHFTIRDVEKDVEIETYDTNAQPVPEIIVPEIDDQDPWESRKAWGKVIDALNRGDMQATSNEKGKIERAQRKMRKDEQKDGRTWEQVFFKTTEEDPRFEELAAKIGAKLETERTKGIWKFDKERLMQPRPYHPGMTPLGRIQETFSISSPASSIYSRDSVDLNGHDDRYDQRRSSSQRGSMDSTDLNWRDWKPDSRRPSIQRSSLCIELDSSPLVQAVDPNTELKHRELIEDFLRDKYSTAKT